MTIKIKRENKKKMENTNIKDNATITVLVRPVKDRQGILTYRMVGDGGKLVDLRWKKDTDLHELNECKKARVTVDYLSDASERYEYPRFYAGGIVAIEKIY